MSENTITTSKELFEYIGFEEKRGYESFNGNYIEYDKRDELFDYILKFYIEKEYFAYSVYIPETEEMISTNVLVLDSLLLEAINMKIVELNWYGLNTEPLYKRINKFSNFWCDPEKGEK